MKPEDFLLKEYDHFAESLWKNEEVGEKRLTLFIGFTTIIISGIITLLTFEPEDWEKVPLTKDMVKYLAIYALIGNLVVGINIFFRILRRNQVTESFKDKLDEIRTYLKELTEDKICNYSKYKGPNKSFYIGGYAETIACINALLLAAILLIYCEKNINPGIISFFSFLLIQLLMIPHFRGKIPIIKRIKWGKKSS